MKKHYILFSVVFIIAWCSFSFKESNDSAPYINVYHQKLDHFKSNQVALINLIRQTDLGTAAGREAVKEQISIARKSLKGIDIWVRYLDPIAYKKLNGPLPVEWETEVFEKFEKPYKREGAGLTLAALYLEEKVVDKDSLINLIQSSISAAGSYVADSITSQLQSHNHFYLANRLFILNLAAIYTTGFECPDTSLIIPELRSMLAATRKIYSAFNESFSNNTLSRDYLAFYDATIAFVDNQPVAYTQFDHFSFIRNYVNPLFIMNQQFIKQYRVYTKSYVDYALNNAANSIFSKDLYFGQNAKGVFLRVDDQKALQEIERIGKLLFYDPVLSANNQRSCNSCHKSTEYFNDTILSTSLQFDRINTLSRNTPSLINATFNHLLMLDGKHISLQNQAKDVITNPLEMGSHEKEIVQKVLNIDEYKKAFKSFLKYTPQEKEVTFEHIVSAITWYYNKFSNFYAPFDDAMNGNKDPEPAVKQGFNLFMSKAQCATCHFVPQFNGVKPPYISTEFEVLGVPADSGFKKLSPDKGRFDINPAGEMLHAFRTGSLRNAAYTKPYMHNGVFTTLEQVVDFYDAGGGVGKGLRINNQTLSADSLRLTQTEKKNLILFIRSLNENINFEAAPVKLPASKDRALNGRKAGGEY